jgi:hypothetical protein
MLSESQVGETSISSFTGAAIILFSAAKQQVDLRGRVE